MVQLKLAADEPNKKADLCGPAFCTGTVVWKFIITIAESANSVLMPINLWAASSWAPRPDAIMAVFHM